MIRDLRVIDIPRACDILPGAPLQCLPGIGCRGLEILKAGDVLADFFGNSRRQYSCVRPGIGSQLLLVQFLCDIERLIRTDLEHAAAVILKLCQVIEQRRILLLFLLLDRVHT